MTRHTYADGRTFTCLTCGHEALMRYGGKNFYCKVACTPQASKGRQFSDTSRARMSSSAKLRPLPEGFTPKKGEHRNTDYYFKKGMIAPNKGKTYRPEQVAAMTAARLPHLRRGRDHPNFKGGLPKCLTCDLQLANYKAQYCRSHAGLLRSGSSNKNWKGGVTDENKALRRKFQATVQPLVLARDNYTCQICTQSGSIYLQVDHIKSWAKYPDLRFEMSNCRTLCMGCHYYVTFKRKMPKGIVWGHNLSRRIAL